MAQDPVPGAGQDGEPVPPGSSVTPDWVDDAEWDRICGSLTGEDEPDGSGEEWDSWDPGPEDGPPADWAVVDMAAVAAQAEADGAEHQAVMRRLIAAGINDGYAHQAGDPPVPGTFTGPAAGFGQGHRLDAAAPCTTLSQLADDASGENRDFTGVTDDQLLGVLSARARLEARAAWERLMAVAEFIRRRPAAGCPLDGPGRMPQVWQETAAGELRAQLHLSPGEASALLDLAHDLAAKLPRTAAALRDGVIDLGRARLMSWRCAVLTPAEARKAEEIIFGDPEVGQWSYGMFCDRVARAVILVNPEAATRRREESARERRVEVWAERSGNAALVGRELPPAAVLAANQVLTARARQLRRAGAAGGMDELRVLAYLEKLGVLDPLSAAQGSDTDGAPSGTPDGHGKAPDGESAGSTPDGHGKAAAGGSGGDGRHGPAVPDRGGPGDAAGAVSGVAPGGFAGRVTMTLPLTTLLGLAERPGMMPGFGTVDPALARELAAAAARNPASTWCLTITDDDGRPIAHGCGRPPPRSPRGPRGPRNQRQHAPPESTIRLSTAAFAGGTGGGADGGREMVFALETLAGPCDHKHQATGHDPGVRLRHLTGILNAHCSFPPCRRAESQSDYEHSVPYHQGGKTCLCEAGPVCRTDHRSKQSPGWRLEEAGARGWFRWTTPSGRSYLSGPTRYPD